MVAVNAETFGCVLALLAKSLGGAQEAEAVPKATVPPRLVLSTQLEDRCRRSVVPVRVRVQIGMDRRFRSSNA